MKAIYTYIDNSIYKVNQDIHVPNEVTKIEPGIRTNLLVNNTNKNLSQEININNIESDVKTNSILYTELGDFLKDEKITEIDNVYDAFKVCIDYSIINERGYEMERSVVFKPIKGIDKLFILGICEDTNECTYRRVKTFESCIKLDIQNKVSLGISTKVKQTYTIKINSIEIYQNLIEEEGIHNSIYETSYNINSSIYTSTIDHMKLIYTTKDEDENINPISIQFLPRMIHVNLNVVLTNYIEVYDDSTVNSILEDNKSL